MVQSTRARRARAETSSASEDTSDAATADTASDGDVHTATRPNGARKPRKSAPVSTSRSTTVTISRGARKSARTIAPPGPESQVIHLKHDASQESDTGDSESQGTLTSLRPHAASTRRTARKCSTRPKQIEPPSSNDEQQDQEDDDDIQKDSDDEGDEQDTTLRQSPPRQPVKSKAARSPAKRAASPADDDDDEDEAREIEEGTEDGSMQPVALAEMLDVAVPVKADEVDRLKLLDSEEELVEDTLAERLDEIEEAIEPDEAEPVEEVDDARLAVEPALELESGLTLELDDPEAELGLRLLDEMDEDTMLETTLDPPDWLSCCAIPDWTVFNTPGSIQVRLIADTEGYALAKRFARLNGASWEASDT